MNELVTQQTETGLATKALIASGVPENTLKGYLGTRSIARWSDWEGVR